METIYMKSENSKTRELHSLRLDLTDKLYLKDSKKQQDFSRFEYLLHLEKHQVRIQQLRMLNFGTNLECYF